MAGLRSCDRRPEKEEERRAREGEVVKAAGNAFQLPTPGFSTNGLPTGCVGACIESRGATSRVGL